MNPDEMTPEQVNVAIAEACEIKFKRFRFWYRGHDNQKPYRSNFDTREEAIAERAEYVRWGCGKVEEYFDPNYLPNYFHSLDAMAQAEATLGEDWLFYEGHLQKIVNDDFRADKHPNSFAISATAAQRARAFLKTKGGTA